MKDDKIQVNLKVDGRMYMLKVKRDEEVFIRRAAAIADREIRQLKSRHLFDGEADAAVLVLIKQLVERLMLEDECEAFSEKLKEKTGAILKELDTP